MRSSVAWAAGLTGSVLLHVLAAVILVPAYEPQDTPDQAPPETRLDMETVDAPRQDATAQTPEGEQAAEGQAQGTTVGAGAVPQSTARPVSADAERPAVATPEATRAEAADAAGAPLAEAMPDTNRLDQASASAERLTPALPNVTDAAEAVAPAGVRIGDAEPDIATATTVVPSGNPAEATTPSANRLAASETAGDTMRPAMPDTERIAVSPAPAAQDLAATRPVTDQLTAALPDTEMARPAAPTSATLAAAPPDAAPTASSELPSVRTSSDVPAVTPAASVAPSITASAALAPSAQDAAPVTPMTDALAEGNATGQMTAALAAEGTALPQESPDAVPAEEAAPPSTSAKAALAWQFGDRVVTDPQALATIQAFMEPAALDDAEGVRDDLSSVLAGVDCARLSATFIPETGVLEMRGHIPDPELQGPILAALRQQVGEGIPVTANLLHLPAPQCGALTGISNVGLPQSTDQFTNARLVGETAHAREYNYTEGQRLQFDLTAPDYDAYVYVDYFNADGEVIHLVPNDTIPLEEQPAKSVFGVGKDRSGRPGLRITIGPPFGQEIAVAFAASHPLYEGLRPIVEPAEPYLEELQRLVAAAREEHADFKGEWVYFFITTAPATQ